MYGLAFALLLAATTQPAAFGDNLDHATSETPSRRGTLKIPRPESYAGQLATATVVTGHVLRIGIGAPPLASSKRRHRPRTGRTGGSNRLERTLVVRTIPTPDVGLPKPISKARKTTSKKVARGSAMPPPHAVPKRRANKRAPISSAPVVITFPSGVSLPIVRGADGKGKEHYDPNRSGNPLLATGGEYRTKRLSKNFSVYEYARSGNRTFDIARIDPRHVACLQSIRDFVGKPVMINSGYRSFKYNKELYRRMHKKSTNSQHISGRATDIKIGGMTGLEIAQAAIDACGSDIAIGLGTEYAHIDARGHFAVWKYDGVSNRQIAKVKRYRMASRGAPKGRGRRLRRGSLW